MSRLSLVIAACFVLLVGCASPTYRGSDGQERGREEAERAYAEAIARTAQKSLDSPLKPTANPFPDYPRQLSQRGVAGSVCISFEITEEGAVSDVKLIGSAPLELVTISLAAISRWRFESPTSNGKATRVRAIQEFKFQRQ